MKYTLGLDLGTNSIGWYLIGENYQIIDRGVVVFPIGTNVDKNGIEKSRNAQRREFRAAKRSLFRFYLRRSELIDILKDLGMMPPKNEKGVDIKTYKIKGKSQGIELYQLRAKALDEKIELKDLARIFFLLNKHRGFKSGSKTILDEDIDQINKKEEGAVKEGIESLKIRMENQNARTIGEYFYFMFCKAQQLYDDGSWHNPNEPIDERAFDENNKIRIQINRGIRREGRYAARWMYENEFDFIWAKQKEMYKQSHPEIFTGSKEEYDELKKKIGGISKTERLALLKNFKETNYWKIRNRCIFYQRPLKSQKKYINKCLFYKSKRTAPVSSFLYQDFRILKQLADLRYTDIIKGTINNPLPKEWAEKLFAYLQANPKLKLRESKAKNEDVLSVLGLDKKLFKFNFDNEDNDKYFLGNTTKSTIYKAVGDKVYFELRDSNKLEKLWHLVYMKRDDDWLEETLSDSQSWPELNDEAISNLTGIDFEDGYASYSSKLLSRIIPYMKEGNDEYEALRLAGFKEQENAMFNNWEPRKSISQIKNQELRNPVVEKSVSEAIKLVNAIIKKHSIDKNNWTIQIESTRELKKPKKERENIRRNISEIDAQRENYAKFLNDQRNNGKLPYLKRPIQKNDSIIFKYELWLELGGDPSDPEFEEFSKVSKSDYEKRLKHKLWLECNRICPYTGKIINLTALFSPNNEVEIEHIIPLSRCLDNSFMNKTLTYSSINRDKGNKTAYEYIFQRGGVNAIKAFEERIKNAHFSEDKIKKHFLRQDVASEFTNDQLANTSYIAKEVRRKMQEVCQHVYFTNGAVTSELRTNDWRLGNLIEKIRYEENTGIDIDEVLKSFSVKRKYFNQHRNENGKTPIWRKDDWNAITETEFAEYYNKTGDDLKYFLSEIDKFDVFKNKTGKKDRTDHRHHSLDAFIIACCDLNIMRELSTLNAQREKQGISLINYDTGELNREKIICPVSYDLIKDSLKDILVVNKTPQRLLVAKKNTTHRKGDKKFHIQRKGTYSVRASLHKDTFYGKLKDPAKQNIDKPQAFVTRYENHVYDFITIESLKDIYDPNIREILRRRIEKYKQLNKILDQKAFEDDPLYMYSPAHYPNREPEKPLSKEGKPLPVIKKVRTVFKDYRSMVELPIVNQYEKINNARYAQSDGNYIMALYEFKEMDKKGKVKVKRDFIIRNNIEAVRLRQKNVDLFPDEKEKNGDILPLMEDCPNLKRGNAVVLFENDEDKATFDWENINELNNRLYLIMGLSSEDNYGIISFLKHNCSSKGIGYPKGAFELKKKLFGFSMRHTQLYATKVKINQTGKLERLYL